MNHQILCTLLDYVYILRCGFLRTETLRRFIAVSYVKCHVMKTNSRISYDQISFWCGGSLIREKLEVLMRYANF